MSQRTIRWVDDPTDRRIMHIRQSLLRGLQQQSPHEINYYDFLLVAKKLNLRFEESTHLMELRKFFFANKNNLSNKRLASLLVIDEQSLRQYRPDQVPAKIIIRFRVEGRIEAIKQLTNQDQDMMSQDDYQEPPQKYKRTSYIQNSGQLERSQEYNEKLTIILSIKVSEMMKKINLLMSGVAADEENQIINLVSIFQGVALSNIPYEVFKKRTVVMLKKLQPEFSKLKLTISEEDIRAIFSILDEHGQGQISRNSISNLLDQSNTARKITRFYENRVNQRMVKNTLFKLNKNNNIQIYQVKNASVLEFKNIEVGLLHQNRSRQKLHKRIPHFGPIKGPGLRPSPSKHHLTTIRRDRHNYSSLTTYKPPQSDLGRQRQKIQQIIRSSKQQKKRSGNDTIANKLRKLFIHKVILPRQKLLEQQKMKYAHNKSVSNKLIVKLV